MVLEREREKKEERVVMFESGCVEFTCILVINNINI